MLWLIVTNEQVNYHRIYEALSARGAYPTFSWFDIVCGLGSFAPPKTADFRLAH
jgi:hypothetical protein